MSKFEINRIAIELIRAILRFCLSFLPPKREQNNIQERKNVILQRNSVFSTSFHFALIWNVLNHKKKSDKNSVKFLYGLYSLYYSISLKTSNAGFT